MHASLLKLAVGEISTFWVIEQVGNELYKHFMKTIQERSYTKDDDYLLNNYCFEVYIEGRSPEGVLHASGTSMSSGFV